MDVDLPGERQVARFFKERFDQPDGSDAQFQTLSSVVRIHNSLAHSKNPILAPSLLGGGLLYGSQLKLRSVSAYTAKKALAAHNNLQVRCSRCREMINADVDAVEEHLSTCLPQIKCQQCGLSISANVDAVEAHLQNCSAVLRQSARHTDMDRTQGHNCHRGTSTAHVDRSLCSTNNDLAILGNALLNSLPPAERGHLVPQASQRPMQVGVLQANESLILAEVHAEVQRQLNAYQSSSSASAARYAPMQIVVENRAAAANNQVVCAQETEPFSIQHALLSKRLLELINSPSNCLAFWTAMHLLLYFGHGYMRHRHYIAEAQQRTDVNLVLCLQRVVLGILNTLS
mmetsp:Transcript_104346/g.207209  ORF Transcript_104346/g.207209 Transcript_104346/m.207209 type:complete len:344 (+) Transcript_104346:64-1095(+)